jgi:bifunctional non-homologous end joining protein LigD
VFDELRRQRDGSRVFLYACDLLELNGCDLRREPIEARKVELAKLLHKAKPGLRLSEHIEGDGVIIYRHAVGLGCEGIASNRSPP